jgi:hypothetical protein
MLGREDPTRIHQLRSLPIARIGIGLAILAAAAILIFARLGHYALWLDEATTALAAIGVWRTGDTIAVIDHNIVAYHSGEELRNLRFRYIPPLPSYLAAPFVGLLGNGSLPARLPFAICGIFCILLILWWLWKDRADLLTWTLLGFAIVGNVSLFLYFRQVRYYGVAILTSLAMAYLYLHWNGRRKQLAIFATISLCLLASNYINYVALYACLAVDYLLWGRKRRPLQWRDWLTVSLPQIVVGTLVVLTWNPLTSNVILPKPQNLWAEKIILLGWNLRDLDRCEFGVGMLMLLVPVFYLAIRDKWSLRGSLALLIYIVVVTIISPQGVGVVGAADADVRYLAPIIPLCIFLGVVAVRTISCGKWWLAVPVAILAFGTNALQFYPLFVPAYRSTIALYLGELRNPPSDPYTVTAKWINAHVQERRSILVVPGYMIYPLMYHSPKAVYAWQLRYPPEPQFKGLDPIHFAGLIPPDYIIAFGKTVETAGIKYQRIATLDTYWEELYGPELIWRTFQPITEFDRKSQAIYIYQRVPPRSPQQSK